MNLPLHTEIDDSSRLLLQNLDWVDHSEEPVLSTHELEELIHHEEEIVDDAFLELEELLETAS